MDLVIEPDGAAVHGACSHCGRETRSVWGYVSRDGAAHAVYFIRWTDGHLDDGAQLAVSVGRWGDGTSGVDRRTVGLECRMGDDRPAYMVIDAASTMWADRELLGEMLARAAVLSDPIRDQVFAIADAVAAEDPRFDAFLGGESGA